MNLAAKEGLAPFQVVVCPHGKPHFERLGSPLLPGYSQPYTYPSGWSREAALAHLRLNHLIW